MIDEPAGNNESLAVTEEYLNLKFPDKKDEIIGLLKKNNIVSDSDIAFDEKIVFIFRKIALTPETQSGITTILNDLDIEAKDITLNEAEQINITAEREKRLSEILFILYKLANHWEILKGLEDKADSFSILNNEDVLRPEEENRLDELNASTAKVFSTLALLTGKYIELLAGYYYSNGGMEVLNDFVGTMEKTKKLIGKKYIALYKSHGWGTELLARFSK
jgi:hypothetical protein